MPQLAQQMRVRRLRRAILRIGRPADRLRQKPRLPLPQRGHGFFIGQIDFGDHQPVGHGCLFDRFREAIELIGAIDRVHGGDDPLQPEMMAQHGFRQ